MLEFISQGVTEGRTGVQSISKNPSKYLGKGEHIRNGTVSRKQKLAHVTVMIIGL